ncbi:MULTISPECIES: sensor histidine kinase [Streptomyces]|uniref:Two-component sensor kinase n=1 Tax=Streptomyces albus (strain ATCC 21838 / DSM 41398 / FERM P-419 / JCM 4703 / NBRC 107858) TaxID=1081613 RepID=A0A0B5F6F0_STRA4|nr:histidine kinase [Streptomyces sp. SCSIO ZS0520]AJE85907.1 two-component sensor kinase [Streptomyces albus]AOU80210.1 two-component sensor kinase [Streptomyces albus]AYN35925.1 histidine kinase [Streptomyces albus]
MTYTGHTAEPTADGAAGRATERAAGREKPRRRSWRGRRDGDRPGPPPSGFTLLPWLLLGLGSLSHLLQGKASNPVIGGLGLLAFNSLYIAVVFRAFDRAKRDSTATRVALAALGLVTLALATGYGGSWLTFFPLFGLACGSVLRGRPLIVTVLALTVLSAVVGAWKGGWQGFTISYGALLSALVTAAILALSETVVELRATRQELARTAVEKERLRFSRDLHDLLGHTLSVIVVKSEVARRLAPRDLAAALAQIDEIESVGRQALTEIREAVTGYRESSLGAELDRAREALRCAGIETAVRQSGPPLDPHSAALLGWVVRESATNAVRHSRAGHCEFTVESEGEEVRLVVTDDGRGPGPGTPGSGLRGLAERLAAVGGSLESGPAKGQGFRVVARLPLPAARPVDEPSLGP